MSNRMKTPPNPLKADLAKNAEGCLAFTDATGNQYEIRPDGVYRKDTRPSSAFAKLCSAMEIVAHTRNIESTEWGVWVRFYDADNQPHEVVLSRRLFSQGKKVEELLASEGLFIPILSRSYSKCTLAEFLNAVPMNLPRALSVSQGGFASNKYDSFVFGKNVVLSLKGAELVKTESADCAAPLNEIGTLEGWQESVVRLTKYSNRLMFALSVGFAAPLLQLLDLPCVTFHLNGSSGDGKSSILQAVASIYGGKERVTSWDKTSNGFEAVAARYNNQPLIVDEIGQANAETLSDYVYKIGNGLGRDRMTCDATLRETARWSLIALSAGEFSLDETRRQKSWGGHANTATGERVRFICIPCNPGNGLGVLDSLPEGVSADAGINEARRTALMARLGAFENTGVAGREYLLKLMQDIADNGVDALKEQYQKIVDRFLKDAGGNGIDSNERRVIRHFAAVALGGALAASYGILSNRESEAACKEEEDAYKAVLACFNAWRESEEAPQRHKEKVMERMLSAPDDSRSKYLTFVFQQDGSCAKEFGSPRDKIAGRVVLRTPENYASWIAAIYSTDQFDQLVRDLCEGESKADMVKELIKAGRLLKRKDKSGNFVESYEKSRQGQVVARQNNALDLSAGSRVYVLIAQSDLQSMRMVDRLLGGAK